MLLSAVLSPKAGQLRQARSPGGTLTWGFKQSYGVCCLTGHVFRGVQWSDVNTKKRTSRNIISNLGAINPTYLLPPPPTPSSIEFDFLLLVSLYLAKFTECTFAYLLKHRPSYNSIISHKQFSINLFTKNGKSMPCSHSLIICRRPPGLEFQPFGKIKNG